MPVVSKELQEERNKIKFNIEEFTNWYYGGSEKVQKSKSLGDKVRVRKIKWTFIKTNDYF
jgi:hypothetical protein